MGLDVLHLKLVTTIKDDLEYIIVDEDGFDCNVDLSVYEDYILDVYEYRYNCEIIVVKSKSEWSKVENRLVIENDTNTKAILFGDISSPFIKREIHKIIAFENVDLNSKCITKVLQANDFISYSHGIDSFFKTQWNKLKDFISFNTDICYHRVSYGNYKKFKALYYLEIGHQRKHMGDNFYSRFHNNMLWGLYSDFEDAYHSVCEGSYYLSKYSIEEIDMIKKEFKRDFVDKFEYGKSLLFVGF